jgi:ABC-type transport system involved in cytochrome c biogenesis permease component
MRVAVRVLLALIAAYCAVVIVALLFAFAITGWELLVLALVFGTVALRVASRTRGSAPRRQP